MRVLKTFGSIRTRLLVLLLLMLAASFAHLVRQARWCPNRTLGEPLVAILHVGYLFIPLGFLLTGLSMLLDHSGFASAGIHAWTTGGVGVVTLAVMTRATLGHTGRTLHADGWTRAIYTLVTVGAALRVAATALPFDYLQTVMVGGLLWSGAFVLFLWSYGPYLLDARPDGRP